MSDHEHLDRFDRMLLAAEPSPAAPVVTMPAPVARPREPVITSKRGSRFVDHAACPMCGAGPIGVEYHGTLMSGAKVHQLAAHTAGMRRVERGQPRCLGAGMRLVLEGDVWKGAV